MENKNNDIIKPNKRKDFIARGLSLSSSPHKGSFYRNLIPGFIDAGAGMTYVSTTATATTMDNNNSSNSNNNNNNNDNNVTNVVSTNDAAIKGNGNDDVDVDVESNSCNINHEDSFSEATTEHHDNCNTGSNSSLLSSRYNHVQSQIIRPKEDGTGERCNINNKNDNYSDKNFDNNDGIEVEIEAKYEFFPSTKPPPSPSPCSKSNFLDVAVKDKYDKTNVEDLGETRSTTRSNCLPTPRPISPPRVTRKHLVTTKRSSSAAAVVEDEESQSFVDQKVSSVSAADDDDDDDESDSSSNHIDRSGDSDINISQSALNLKEELLHSFVPPRLQKENRKQEQNYQPDRLQRPLPFLMKREVSTFSLAPEIGALMDQEEHQDKLRQWKIKERSIRQEYYASQNNDDDEDEEDTAQQQEQEGETQPQPNKEIRDITELRIHLPSNVQNDYSDDNNDNNKRRLDKIALQENDQMEGQKKGGFKSFTGTVFDGNTSRIKRERHEIDPNYYCNRKEGDDILSSSEVSSTCSEFGTIIQMGDAAISARMAEIEEMELAALDDLSEEEEGEYAAGGIRNDVKEDVRRGIPSAPISSSSLRQHSTSLDLPILSSRSFSQEGAIATTATPDIVSKRSSIQVLHPRREQERKQQSSSVDKVLRNTHRDRPYAKIDNYYDNSAKVTAISANATTCPNKQKSTTSEIVSAAFRRMGPINSLNKPRDRIQNSLSDPTTTPPLQLQKKEPPKSAIGDSKPNPARHVKKNITTANVVPPPSFVLRSPGSSARFSLAAHQSFSTLQRRQRKSNDEGFGNSNRTILSPRFSTLLRGRKKGGTTSTFVEEPTTNPSTAASPLIPLSPRMAIKQSVQLAQKCFSYDNTLSEYSVNDYEHEDEFENDNNNDERRMKLREQLVIPSLGRPTVSRMITQVLPLESSLSFSDTKCEGGYLSGNHHHSKSYDLGRVNHDLSGTVGSESELLSRQQRKQKESSPFREPVFSRTEDYPFLQNHFPVGTNAATISEPPTTAIDLRGRNYSDFSPTKYSKNNTLALNSTMELQTPQRIEIEREDALDILACLVERGIVDWNTSIDGTASVTKTTQKNHAATISAVDQSKIDDRKLVAQSSNATQETVSPSSSSSSSACDIMRTVKEEEKQDEVSQITQRLTHGLETCDGIGKIHSDMDSPLFRMIETFRIWSQEHDADDNSSDNDVAQQHSRRMLILGELLRSHAYAVEMKRAASSASTWLKSIGRGHTENIHNFLKDGDEKCGRGEPISAIINSVVAENNDKKLNNNNTIDKMELMTLKATLHSTQLELVETKQVNMNLNEELSQCRAEIGRMKSISRNEHTNRSILDDSHDAEGSSTAPLSEISPKDFSVSPASDSDGKCLLNIVSDADHRDGRLFQGVTKEDAKERIECSGADVIVLKSALEKANGIIRRLHGELHKDIVVKGEEIEPTPVVDVPDIQVKSSRPRSTASTPDSSPDHRTVNVRMLDGENFVTDWNDLNTLSPPPDHGLQSPIVRAVLEQWTQDRSLHESLLSWIEEVMKGNDLEGLPPLTISSLDHQVRDGFSMHVLPHLLRRADIHVSIKTRAHRQTTYDMSVTVSQKDEFMVGLSEVPISSSLSSVQPQGEILPQQQFSLLDRRDSQSQNEDEWAQRSELKPICTESVAHSAVTETITNLTHVPQNQTPHTPIQSYHNMSSQLRSCSGSADTFDASLHYRQREYEQQQVLPSSSGTIMSALGGALSGLLSRNKCATPGRVQPQNQYCPMTPADDRESSNMLPASLRAQMDLTSSPVPGSSGYHRVGNLETAVSAAIHDQQQQEDLLQPYHRVVSAPPGRIGVTFVEFRGHAMVSDVATDSPLAGWVFPSDILIAVDEIPVSGMRVRDIVKILSTRKDRQRAMRVISSHAMNEFTMMNQVGGPLNEDNGEDE